MLPTPIAYYKLDGNSNDSVGTNNGTDTSITYSNTYGKLNQGANFGGSSYISIGNPQAGLTAMTIVAWVNPQNTNNTQQQIVYLGGNGLGNQNFPSVQLSWGSVQQKFAGNVLNSGTWVNAVSTNTYASNAWYQVGITITTSNLILYVNGAAVTNTSFTSTQSSDTTNSSFGSYNRGLTQTFIGYADEISIFGVALSAAQMAEICNGSAGFQYPFSRGTFLLNMI